MILKLLLKIIVIIQFIDLLEIILHIKMDTYGNAINVDIDLLYELDEDYVK